MISLQHYCFEITQNVRFYLDQVVRSATTSQGFHQPREIVVGMPVVPKEKRMSQNNGKQT